MGCFQRVQEVVTFEAFKLGLGEELRLRAARRRRFCSLTRSNGGRGWTRDGQIKIQNPTAGQNHRTLNHVAQFANIARPAVRVVFG